MAWDRLFICGVTHHDCPPDLATPLFREPQNFPDTLRWLREGPLAGAVWLGTCNRLQVMGELPPTLDDPPTDELTAAMARFSGLEPSSLPRLHNHWKEERGVDAVHRLCRIASSLDAERVGEPFIAAQLADAWRMSRRGGLAGDQLAKAIDRALSFARHCHVAIGLCDHPTDLPSALLLELGTQFHGIKGLMIGITGWHEDAPQILRALRQEGANCCHLAPSDLSPTQAEQLRQTIGPTPPLDPTAIQTTLSFGSANSAITGIPTLDLSINGPDRERLIVRASKGANALSHAIKRAEMHLSIHLKS